MLRWVLGVSHWAGWVLEPWGNSKAPAGVQVSMSKLDQVHLDTPSRAWILSTGFQSFILVSQ